MAAEKKESKMVQIEFFWPFLFCDGFSMKQVLLFEDQNKLQTSRKNLENSRLIVSKFVTGSREYDIKLENISRYCSPVINQILLLQNVFEPIVDTKK